ncbi:hypothetical protein C8F01DRAFT_1231375 [Mycena amicta]|nr:hypothetical protein C8F01DRAFT_1231375 [Mycena amicta]
MNRKKHVHPHHIYTNLAGFRGVIENRSNGARGNSRVGRHRFNRAAKNIVKFVRRAGSLGVPIAEAKLDAVDIAEVVPASLFKAVVDDGEGGQQEALFTVVGVLGRKEFPPVSQRDINTQTAVKLSQLLVMHGCGTSQLECLTKLVTDLHWMASETITSAPVYVLDPLTVHPTLKLSFGLNTHRSDIPDKVKVVFNEWVDPEGLLADLRIETLDHCFDNAMQYLEFSDTKFTTINPVAFQQYDGSLIINVLDYSSCLCLSLPVILRLAPLVDRNLPSRLRPGYTSAPVAPPGYFRISPAWDLTVQHIPHLCGWSAQVRCQACALRCGTFGHHLLQGNNC